eukprot:965239_1
MRCVSHSNRAEHTTCGNITIRVVDPIDSIDIICKKSNACSNMTIKSEYISESFSLQCIGGKYSESFPVCENLYIDIKRAKSVSITCFTYGCSDIVVFASDANVVSVVANGASALLNSTVYATYSNQLDVTCLSMSYNSKTCSDLNIYLSSLINANSLNCQFGCERINLHFLKDINMSLFDSISFTECAACRTGDCFNIDEW